MRLAGSNRLVWWMLGAYAILVATGMMVRPLLPVDETRYATVAWEMWSRGEWIVPQLNGVWYDHKPPVLFWLIHAGWALFGVSEAWLRLIGPLVAVLDLWLLLRLAARLWPERPAVPLVAGSLFLGSWYVALYSTGLMFDLLLLAWILGAWIALWDARAWGRWSSVVLLGVCIGGGLLTKGPVTLLYVLPVAFAATFWSPVAQPWPGRQWHPRVFLAIGIGTLVASAWLLAGYVQVGQEFLDHVLWKQTAGRVAGDFGHGRPWWWYVPHLPLLLLPWIAWPPLWRAARGWRDLRLEPGARFCLIVLVATLVGLGAIAGKQVHYLIPAIASIALIAARLLADVRELRRALDDVGPALLMCAVPVLFLIVALDYTGASLPPWVKSISSLMVVAASVVAVALIVRKVHTAVGATAGMTVASLVFASVLLAGLMTAMRPYYDLVDAGRYVGAQQMSGRPIAFLGGRYQGEYGWFGRLQEPIRVLDAGTLQAWLVRHPDGLVISREKRLAPDAAPVLEFRQPYKTDALLMARSSELLGARTALEAGGVTSSPAPSPPSALR